MSMEAAMPAAVAEVKALLRIGDDREDALIDGFSGSAFASCEAFTGRMLIARAVRETVPARGAWTRLAAAPVRSIEAVATISADGSETVLATGDYGIDIDAAGEGWVRVAAGGGGRAAVDLTAGIATGWDEVPAPLRQGIVRLAAHLYGARGDRDEAPPASVAALWRPWRRLRLG